MPRISFLLIAALVICLTICFPLGILISWLFSTSLTTTLLMSFICAIPLSAFMWFTIQSSNLALKWPMLQLLGLTTILATILCVALPLHLFMSSGQVGVIALILWVAAAAYAIRAAHVIKDVPLTITSDKLDKPYKLVQLSDLHAGSRSRRFIDKIVTQARTHQPDAVFITGDLLDSSDVDAGFLAPLAKLDCPVWMCLGNHERYVDLDSAIDAIEQHNVTILRDRMVSFQHLQIIGIDDTDNPAQAAKQLSTIQLTPNRFSVLLYHRPDGWDAAIKHGIDITLSGHTHAGQIWPFGLLVKRQFPQMAGHFSRGGQHMFVSQGTGTWGPTMRFGTQCEMTVIELLPK